MDHDLLFLTENSYLKWEMLKIRIGVHEINKERERYGEFHTLYGNLREHPSRFFGYTRMSVRCFDYILDSIRSDISKVDTNFHKSIKPEERLFVTIRYLSTGLAFRSLAYSFRMGVSTVSEIVYSTCEAIWKNNLNVHMPQPSEDQLMNIASDFREMWHFPNCIGSLDGKHCRVKRPKKSGSAFFYYKHYFSIVLQAVAHARKRFLTIEVGGRGKQSDGGTFNASSLNRLLERGAFNIPEPRTLPNSNITAPYVILADEAYPLKEYIMRPYPQRTLNQDRENFNNRLSRARKTVECAFGILCNKWRVLLKPIETDVKHARLIIKTACLLHNIVIDTDGYDCDNEFTIPTRHQRRQTTTGRNNNPSNRVKQVRNLFTKYFWENSRLIYT